MADTSLPRRVALVLAGALLAGVISGIAEAGGLAETWAVVAGMSAGAPLLDAGLHPGHAPADRGDRLVMTAVMVAGGLVVGSFFGIAVTLTSVGSGVGIAVAALGAYAGALAARHFGTDPG